MKKAVLREYLKNREKDVTTINQDSFFTIEVDDVDVINSDNDTLGKFIKKAAKEAVEIYEEKVVKPKKAKKGDK